jgi:hypothetical protein
MFRPLRKFCTLTVILGTAVLVEGCSQKTIYSEMYSPKRNRFVATVERQTVTELPPETTTTTTTTTVMPQAAPLPAPGLEGMVVPEPATPPEIPGLEAVPAAPMDAAPAAPMDAAPAAPLDAAPAAPMDAAPAAPVEAVPPAL